MHVYAVVDTDLDFCLLAEYSVTINNTTIVPEGYTGYIKYSIFLFFFLVRFFRPGVEQSMASSVAPLCYRPSPPAARFFSPVW
jgi:hypothetical protein